MNMIIKDTGPKGTQGGCIPYFLLIVRKVLHYRVSPFVWKVAPKCICHFPHFLNASYVSENYSDGSDQIFTSGNVMVNSDDPSFRVNLPLLDPYNE